jgi:hypothetical protein
MCAIGTGAVDAISLAACNNMLYSHIVGPLSRLTEDQKLEYEKQV